MTRDELTPKGDRDRYLFGVSAASRLQTEKLAAPLKATGDKLWKPFYTLPNCTVGFLYCEGYHGKELFLTLGGFILWRFLEIAKTNPN